MHCLQCQYDLHACRGHTCPECGRPFNPDDPDSYCLIFEALSTGERVRMVAGFVAWIGVLAMTLSISPLLVLLAVYGW